MLFRSTVDAVERSFHMLRGGEQVSPAEVLSANILSNRGKTIRPKTLNQKRYVDAIDEHTIVFGIGPAGTGKTYLAVAKAVQALQSKQINRIILTRPAVEAGERLGFLPGTLSEKIDPYLRPLYDALHQRGGIETYVTRHEQGAAYMAYGYAESTGKVGTYLVVPGPGLLNTCTALCTIQASNAQNAMKRVLKRMMDLPRDDDRRLFPLASLCAELSSSRARRQRN